MTVYNVTANLVDNVSAPAKSAGGNVAALAEKMRGLAVKKLADDMAGLSSKMKGLDTNTKDGAKEFASLSKEMKGLEAKKASNDLAALNKEMKRLDDRAAASKEASNKLNASMLGVAGMAATAAIAVVGVTVKLMAFAVGAVEAKQKLLTMFDALGQGKTSGAATLAMMDQLGDKIGMTREQLGPLAQQLMSMGVTDLPALKAGMLAAASATALMGESGGASFMELQRKIQGAAQAGQGLKLGAEQLAGMTKMGVSAADVAGKLGISVKDLNDKLTAGSMDADKFGDALNQALTEKGAGPLAKLSNSLGALTGKFKESMMMLFEDVGTGDFMTEMKGLLGIFSQATPSGKAMKAAIGGAFSAIFAIATAVIPVVRNFLLDLGIWALKAYISFKPAIKAFKEFMGMSDGLGQNKEVLDAIGTALTFLAQQIVVGVVVIGAIVAAFAVLTKMTVTASTAIYTLASDAIGYLKELPVKAMALGSEFVSALASGITGGADAVIGAVKGLADKATGAFKAVFGVSGGAAGAGAPSLPGHATGGVVTGITNGVANVSAAAGEGLASIGKGETIVPAGESSGGGGGKGGRAINIQASFTFSGAAGAALEVTEEAISLIFERMALESGV